MYASKIPVLSAPKDEFLTDLERFSIPFGVEINGRWISTPSSVWQRVFNGPHGADGKPLNGGGIPAKVAKVMRAEAFSLPGHRRSKSARPPAHPNGCFILGAEAVTAPPAREPATGDRAPRTAFGAASAHEKGNQ